MPDFVGVSHVALTVTDLEASKGWYTDVLGWQLWTEGEDGGTRFALGAFPTGLFLGLRVHDGGSADRFDAGRTGLDHLSFSVASRTVLEEWQAFLSEKSVELTPIQDVDYGHVLNFRDPDNIALELFALPGS